MSSKVAELADAVKSFINDDARTYSMEFTATRLYTPAIQGEDQEDGAGPGEDLEVVVVGASRRRVALTREHWQKFVTILIGVRKRLTVAANPEDPSANAEVDALMALCEEIEDSFDGGALGVTGAVLQPQEGELTFEAPELRAGRFLGVITLVFTYKE